MFTFTSQILSPLAAYLQWSAKNLGINTETWSIEESEDTDLWHPKYIVGEYTSDSIIPVAQEQAVISLNYTGCDNETVDGSGTLRHTVRIVSAANKTAVASSNRDAALAFIEHGLTTRSLSFPGLAWSGIYTLVAKPQLTYIKKDRVHIAPATILIGMSKALSK